MAFSRGKFGIEYNDNPLDESSGGWGWILVVIAIVTVASLVWTVVGRIRSSGDDAPTVQIPVPEPPAPPPPPEHSDDAAPAAPEPPPADTGDVQLGRRPPALRNLLMRLDEARRKNDIEMEATTIEQIRALPGSPAADLDDTLARRLGVLNLRRLYEKRSKLWVAEVSVRRGDSASRIAKEHGSTLASLSRLNGGKVDKVFVGQRLFVLNHPRFNLVVHRRSRTADLQLNGKFFRRYDFDGPVTGKAGAYEIQPSVRSFCAAAGLRLKPVDRTELETLLPIGTSVLISEM